MAAGLGFKDFTTGEVLTAADVDGYLMQGIWVFASATARDAAVTSPQEGNFAYLKDTNTTTYYTGSAWTNLDTTGMTNPMTTTGDMVYSSSGSTPARLGIGTTGQVLTVAAGIPSWATGVTEGTWTNYTPTVSAEVGTCTGLNSQGGRYQMLNSKTCLVQASWRTGSNIGTATGYAQFSLPFTSKSTGQMAVGSSHETESAGTGGWVSVAVNASVARANRYDNGNNTWWTINQTIRAQVVFEVA